eukprot:1813426-Pyramimonas_sp.AAC.1
MEEFFKYLCENELDSMFEDMTKYLDQADIANLMGSASTARAASRLIPHGLTISLPTPTAPSTRWGRCADGRRSGWLPTGAISPKPQRWESESTWTLSVRPRRRCTAR